MRFLAVDRLAAHEIISDRLLQSVEYKNGQMLAAALEGDLPEAPLSSRLRLIPNSDGLLFMSTSGRSADYVVFDLETCDLFGKKHSPADEILYFQKVLRFATKIWGNLKLSAYERPLAGSSKAVIFPYPISQQTAFRIVVELAPDSKRLEKRLPHGRFLLVYRCGTDDGGGPQEQVKVTNFRRFYEALQSLPQQANTTNEGIQSAITSLAVTELETPVTGQINPFQGYDRWLPLLTERQKNFVTPELRAPHRIEGPAGTGKTVCLILKAITGLRVAKQSDREYKSLFITHSEATRRTVQQMIVSNDPDGFLDAESQQRAQTLTLTTLQQLCATLLVRKIHEAELIDRDAMESKQLQLLYVKEALEAVIAEEYQTHKRFLSKRFDEFFTKTDGWILAEMLQHEISVVIKGRAGEKLENYRKLPPLRYGLPTETSADRGLVWGVFKKYQTQLQTAAQFDTDDIVLTTIGQLDTPIWRRRREREGYDAIYIDETHLFNMNELSIFHYLSKSDALHPIAYSVDRSQAIGDRGWTDESFGVLAPNLDSSNGGSRTEVHSVFRCSPDIVDLAFSVTSAGATLFTNFDDPLKLAGSMFTVDEERKCAPPSLASYRSDDDLIAGAFTRAENLVKEMDTSRCDVALVAFSDELFRKAEAYAREQNKPVEVLKQRGDIEVVQRAQKSRKFVLSTPEYVGGLEFDGVILLGVDEGRVPPAQTMDSADSANFLSYAFHNRLYVAITRARYRLEILINKLRGPSSLLHGAIQSGLLKKS